ncbi:SPFH domain-containing protein [Streptomyces brevispora]|uniref:SPFH domain-containing protein n=1 Tax=Streptomyces brevispora TaxID=887462 RepID=UPI002E35D31B|nr:SPFH domain-containing protein [Streptomyces brevispora]
MRSTVSDSSGNPENGDNPENSENPENPEYGEERYGALPVREWAVLDRPGRGADASARADGVPGQDGPKGSGATTGAYDWSASASASASASTSVSGSTSAPGSSSGSASGSASGSGFGPVYGGGSVTRAVPDSVTRAVPESVARSGTDSVVDLVLDLMPGEGERGGSAFGATSASVSVPGDGSGSGEGSGAEDGGGSGSGSGSGSGDGPPGTLDLLPAATAEKGDRVPVAESGALPGAGSVTGSRGAVAGTVPGQPVLEYAPFLPGPDDAPGPGTGFVPGPGLSPVRQDAGPSLSPPFGGVGAGELRTAVRVDTGRRHSDSDDERTVSIPVHLLFREGTEAAADAAALPATVVQRTAGNECATGVRRPPVPRAPQVLPSTRPAPVADPQLRERPGPSLPGWAALLAGLGGLAASGGVLWWIGALPGGAVSRLGLGPRPYDGIGLGAWAALTALLTTVLFAFGGLTRGQVGYAWVLTLFGRYRGSVRRTGLMWVSPLLLRRRVDVRLRHWRSEPLPAVDANGTALRVVVLVVWRVTDTVRATLGIADHEEYLREQVEAAMARVLSQLPADAFHEDAHTLRNAEAVGDALTRMLKADCEPVGIEVYSAQPTGIEYAPEVAAAMQRRRIAAIDAKHRDSVLTSVVDAVDDTVNRLTARGLVELDDYERKSLVKDLTVAFYTGRSGGDSA